MSKEAGRTHDPEAARARRREQMRGSEDPAVEREERLPARGDAEEQERQYHEAPARPERPDDEGPARDQEDPPAA